MLAEPTAFGVDCLFAETRIAALHLFAELGHLFAKPLDTLVFHFPTRIWSIDYPDFAMRPLLPTAAMFALW